MQNGTNIFSVRHCNCLFPHVSPPLPKRTPQISRHTLQVCVLLLSRMHFTFNFLLTQECDFKLFNITPILVDVHIARICLQMGVLMHFCEAQAHLTRKSKELQTLGGLHVKVFSMSSSGYPASASCRNFLLVAALACVHARPTASHCHTSLSRSIIHKNVTHVRKESS